MGLSTNWDFASLKLPTVVFALFLLCMWLVFSGAAIAQHKPELKRLDTLDYSESVERIVIYMHRDNFSPPLYAKVLREEDYQDMYPVTIVYGAPAGYIEYMVDGTSTGLFKVTRDIDVNKTMYIKRVFRERHPSVYERYKKECPKYRRCSLK